LSAQWHKIKEQFGNLFDLKLEPFTSLIPERIISWKSYWALIPISVLSTLIFVAPSIGNKSLALTWLAISLIGHASMAPFVIHFNGKYDRRLHLIFGLIAGAVRGATINLIAPVLLVEDPMSLTLRVANSSISVLYAFVISSLVISIWNKFDSDLRQLLSNTIEFGSSTLTDLGTSSLRRLPPKGSEKIQSVIAELKNFIELSTLEGRRTLTLKEQASAIDRLINKHIRPHSAERWRQSELIWPKIRPWKVVRESLSKTELPVFSTFFLVLPLTLFGQISRTGAANSLLVQLASFITLIVIILGSRLLSRARKNPIESGNRFFLLFAFCVYLPTVTFASYFIDFDSFTSSRNFFQTHIATVLAFIALILIGAIAVNVQNDRENALETLRSFISERGFENMVEGGIVASTQSEYAQYLHAEVQSQLMACKLLLLKAAESEFTLLSPEVTQKVLDRLDLLKVPYEKKSDRIPSIRLREFQKTWLGLASMDFDLPPELSQPSRNGEIISQLIEELIVNAIRHGKAKNISISASVSGGRCLISVLDDGKLKSTKKTGLGSTLFEVFAPDWKLVSTPRGTLATLSARFY
jgi:signal transduction histidine kinase